MFRAAVNRLVASLGLLSVCALLAGCLGGGPTYFPYLFPPGPERPSHPKPPGPGYFADFDPHACRLEMRPNACTAPVRGTQVFIATVYDSAGVPRRGRRVEWMIEGPGSIIEVDESGWRADRGMKIDNKFAYSLTDYFQHCLTRGKDEFTIGPGQTWCIVSSPVEGETVVTAYAPAIADWDKNRAYARISWTEAGLVFPPPVTTRAGGELTLSTRVQKDAGPVDGYSVRYRIADGPPAALTTHGGPVDSVKEAVSAVGPDGAANVTIAQPLATAGMNRVAIEVIKSNPDSPGQFTVVSTGETTVTWQSAELNVRVTAPKSAALNQDTTVTYAVANPGKIAAGTVTLTAQIPAGMNLVRTEPHAAVDDNTLIWTLPADAKAKTVQAVYRPAKVGATTVSAEIRSEDGTVSRGSTAVTIRESKLVVRIEGPQAGVAGEAVPFQVVVTNEGEIPADKVHVQARLNDGAESAAKTSVLDEVIATIRPGQSRTLALPITAQRAGKLTVEAGATAGTLVAVPQTAAIEIKDAQLAITAHGPNKGYVGQDVTWQLVIRNNGDVPLEHVTVRATLPPEVALVKATDEGRASGKQIVWELGSAPARQERVVSATVRCERASGKALLSANVTATPAAPQAGAARTVSRPKPIGPAKPANAALEIIGVPALQIAVTDANDPVAVGQRTTYTIRLKNAGTSTATQVEVLAEVPGLLRPVRATGPGQAGRIDGQRVTFPKIATLAANAESTFVVEVEGLVPGNARFRAEALSPSLTQPVRAEEPTRVLGREVRPNDF